MATTDDAICESCGKQIPEEAPCHPCTDGGFLCKPCSPTFQDMLDHPELFMNADDEPMTLDEAKAIVDPHLASGGSLSDSLSDLR